jgi:hypothetical protein
MGYNPPGRNTIAPQIEYQLRKKEANAQASLHGKFQLASETRWGKVFSAARGASGEWTINLYRKMTHGGFSGEETAQGYDIWLRKLSRLLSQPSLSVVDYFRLVRDPASVSGRIETTKLVPGRSVPYPTRSLRRQELSRAVVDRPLFGLCLGDVGLRSWAKAATAS